jgi:hypothetical protein
MTLIKKGIFEMLDPYQEETEVFSSGLTVSMNDHIKELYSDEVKNWINNFTYLSNIKPIYENKKLFLYCKGDFVIKDDGYGGLSELPEFINFIVIEGDFIIISNLQTMRGFPKEIKGDLYLSGNKLSSLNYCPKKVHGDFFIRGNDRKFTKEEIKKVCEVGGSIIV